MGRGSVYKLLHNNGEFYFRSPGELKLNKILITDVSELGVVANSSEHYLTINDNRYYFQDPEEYFLKLVDAYYETKPKLSDIYRLPNSTKLFIDYSFIESSFLDIEFNHCIDDIYFLNITRDSEIITTVYARGRLRTVFAQVSDLFSDQRFTTQFDVMDVL